MNGEESREIAPPTLVDIALIADLIHHHRFAEAGPVFVRILRGLVEVSALEGAVGNPKSQ